MKAYFAHPVTDYGSAREKSVLKALTAQGFQIVNPADPVHQEKAKALREKIADREEASRQIMEYFYAICRGSDACVMLAFPDGSLGAGVVGEAETFLKAGKKVYEACIQGEKAVLKEVPSLSTYKCLTVAETREMLSALRKQKQQASGFKPSP